MYKRQTLSLLRVELVVPIRELLLLLILVTSSRDRGVWGERDFGCITTVLQADSIRGTGAESCCITGVLQADLIYIPL